MGNEWPHLCPLPPTPTGSRPATLCPGFEIKWRVSPQAADWEISEGMLGWALLQQWSLPVRSALKLIKMCSSRGDGWCVVCQSHPPALFSGACRIEMKRALRKAWSRYRQNFAPFVLPSSSRPHPVGLLSSAAAQLCCIRGLLLPLLRAHRFPQG